MQVLEVIFETEVQDFRIFTCHCSTGDLCYDPWGESVFYFNIWSFELDFLEIWVWVCFGIFKINFWITVFFSPLLRKYSCYFEYF